MTEDYLAISNTGKNITITMTPGMKQRILGTHGRIRLRLGVDNSSRAVVLIPCGPGHGYKLIRRKSVWNMSVSSKRFPSWPVHQRTAYLPPYALSVDGYIMVTLPKPAQDMDSMLKNLTEKLRREMPPPPPTHIDHSAMNRPVPTDDFERNLRAELLLAAREPVPARHLFIVPDMVVAAITGACGGFIIAVLLAAAGVLK